MSPARRFEYQSGHDESIGETARPARVAAAELYSAIAACLYPFDTGQQLADFMHCLDIHIAQAEARGRDAEATDWRAFAEKLNDLIDSAIGAFMEVTSSDGSGHRDIGRNIAHARDRLLEQHRALRSTASAQPPASEGEIE